MYRGTECTNPRPIASRHDPSRWASTKTDTRPLLGRASRSIPATADSAIVFGRFCLLLRRRELLAEGIPVELGTRAFDLLLVLLQANGLLVTKQELLNRVWRGIVVSEENLKVQVAALRKALGEDRDIIRTEFGRGYRFTGVLSSDALLGPQEPPMRAKLRSGGAVFPRYCRQSLRRSFSRAADEAR